MTDGQRLDMLEELAKASCTGISFDWIPSVEGEKSGFRFMIFHHVGELHVDLRAAIDSAINFRDAK